MRPSMKYHTYSVVELILALSEAQKFHQTKEVILKESCNISEGYLMQAREDIEKLHQQITRLENANMDSSGLHGDLVNENDSLKKEMENLQDLLRAAQREIEALRLREQTTTRTSKSVNYGDMQELFRTAQDEIETLRDQNAKLKVVGREDVQDLLRTAQKEIEVLREQNNNFKSLKDDDMQDMLRTAKKEIETLRDQNASFKGVKDTDVRNQLQAAQQKIKTLQEQNASYKNAKDEAVHAVEKEFVDEMADIKANVEDTIKQLQVSKEEIFKQLETAVKPDDGPPQPATTNGIDKARLVPILNDVKKNLIKAEKDLRTARSEITRLRFHAAKRGIVRGVARSNPADPKTPGRSTENISSELEATRQNLKEACDEIRILRARTTLPVPTPKSPVPETAIPNPKDPVPSGRKEYLQPTPDEIITRDFRKVCQSIRNIANGRWYSYDDALENPTDRPRGTRATMTGNSGSSNILIRDRKLRVLGKLFELVYKNILIERSFETIANSQRADIDTAVPQAQIFFRKRRLNPESLQKWETMTFDCLEQCRSTEQLINICATEMFSFFKPILSSRITPSDEKELLSVITELCDEAYDLRLKLYQTPETSTSRYECKMMDLKESSSLSSNLLWVDWVAVEGGTDEEMSDVVEFVLSGALVKHSRGYSVVLEKARVVLRRSEVKGGWDAMMRNFEDDVAKKLGI